MVVLIIYIFLTETIIIFRCVLRTNKVCTMICKHGDYHTTNIALFTVVLVVKQCIYMALLEHRCLRRCLLIFCPVKKLYYTIIAAIATLQEVQVKVDFILQTIYYSSITRSSFSKAIQSHDIKGRQL